MRLFYKSIIFILLVSLCAVFIYAENEKKAISEGVLRLHIVAESDDEVSQKLKLKVRDAVLNVAADIFADAGNKNEALCLAQENVEAIKKAAEITIKEEGFDIPVSVDVGKTAFPLKVYKNIRLPEGVYDSVNVKIGKAKGKNWWCIMYPALCFSGCIEGIADEAAEKRLKKELGEDRFRLITDAEDKKIKIKFKILEIF